MKKIIPALLSLSVIAAPVLMAAPAQALNSGRTAIETSAPEYPRGAERRGIEGSVTVSFTIAADGSVTDAEVVAASPQGVFDRAALQAVESWRYEPSDAASEGQTRDLDFRLNR